MPGAGYDSRNGKDRVMAFSRFSRFLVIVAVLGIGSGLIGLFVAFGPPQLFAKTSTPQYCATCHVMETEYEAWFHTGAHKRIACVDCHLPHDSEINYAVWKSIDGIHDMYQFYIGGVADRIELSHRGSRTVVANCQRCHSETMARLTSEDRSCWTCHRRMSHRNAGAMETRAVNMEYENVNTTPAEG